MGGLAAIIDWERPLRSTDLDPMLTLVPHRTIGGVGRIAFDTAVLAEGHFVHGAPTRPTVTTLDHLAIVGDIRLWNRERLRARAGGRSAATRMDDRRLLLEAYHRTGIDFLDDVDGDFAFIIWDNQRRRLVAVRDRFGARPLFLERTPTGIRFASEVKQLVATSDRAVEPCLRSLSEYVADRYDETRFTFFEGVERVRPSTALMADPNGSSVVRYWEPMPRSGRTTDVQEGFREQLVAAVRSRTDGAESTVSHLTGGLDSTTIAASAQILADRGQLRSTFRTVSAVFPGYANDESEAIGEVATLQPFPHNEFVPQHETIERLEADMWESDTPRPALIDALWSGTIDIGHATGADLVLAGTGGDEVLDQYSLAADLLRRGHLLRWGREVHARAAWSNRHVGTIAGESARVAIPGYLKRPLRRMLDRATPDAQSLIHPSVAPILDRTPVEANPTVRAFPSLTQNLMVSSTRAPLLGLLLEYDEQRYARDGLVVSYPYLDRRLVEFVAAVPLVRRPSVGGSKALARSAFSQSLPASVIERRFKTVANDYLDAVVARLAPQFRERYATITDAASPYLNANWYHANLPAADASEPGFRFGESLWKAWTIMAWLDGLDRYRTAKPNDAEHH